MEINIMKNMEPAEYYGSRFGQDVEVKGAYVVEKTKGSILLDGWVDGVAKLNNPLYIDLDKYDDIIQYKRDLAEKYGATGAKLTKKLMADGYDSIVTMTKKYGTGEIILFPNANFKLNIGESKNLVKGLLRESLVFELIDSMIDEDYPQSWNIEEFKTLTSFNARVKYCEEHLQRISSGSSRIVYKIDNERVLKLAKNKKGLAQNEVEVDYSNEPYIDDILAKIYEYDENYLWVEMELAKKLKVDDFKRIVGFDFKDYIQAVKIIGSQANPRLNGRVDGKIDPDLLEAMYEDEFISGIFDYVGNYNIPVGDLMRMSTYGVVKGDGEDRVVVIDYGLDNGVYDSYYS